MKKAVIACKLKEITVARVMSWKPCSEYTKKRVKCLFGKRKTLNTQHILDLDIDEDDKMWVLCHMLGNKQNRLFACNLVSKCIKYEKEKGRGPGEKTIKGIKVSRDYANGKATLKQLHEASRVINKIYNPAWWCALDTAYCALSDGKFIAYPTALRVLRVISGNITAEREKIIKLLVKTINE